MKVLFERIIIQAKEENERISSGWMVEYKYDVYENSQKVMIIEFEIDYMSSKEYELDLNVCRDKIKDVLVRTHHEHEFPTFDIMSIDIADGIRPRYTFTEPNYGRIYEK